MKPFMHQEDIRWKQRFQNYLKAFALLEDAVLLSQQKTLNDLEEQGLIQRFEFTHELAWNTLKDFLVYQGNTWITGSRDTVREAFNKGLIEDGDGWMEMIRSRNMSSHTYDESVANEIVVQIVKRYYPLFDALKDKFYTLH